MSAPDFTISVAPMEGVTTFPMRLWLHLTSQPTAMTTPFLRVTQVFPGDEVPADFAPELSVLRGVLPYELTPQLIATGPDAFLRAAELFAQVPVLELNCGCPSPNGMGALAGSGILRDGVEFGRIVRRLAAAQGDGRLAIKMRLGVAAPEEFTALLAALAELPLAKLSVHGRTRAEGYRGRSRWDLIGRAAASAPDRTTWASGDILGHASLAALRRVAPQVGGAMVGRGLLRNPWLCAELRAGAPLAIDREALANALLVYAVLGELWRREPAKLIARLGRGQLNQPCLVEAAAWERAAAELTGLCFGLPFVLSRRCPAPAIKLPPRAWSAVKWLWSHLRSSLPAPFWAPALAKATDAEGFFTALGAVEAAEPLVLRHRPEWDGLFANARGAAAAPSQVPQDAEL